MEKKQHYYQIIKGILLQIATPPYNKEEIKAEIVTAISGYDYISAVIDYLWGAYYNFDPAAKVAFEKIFADDLKARKPDVFYFFSFYFSNNLMRRGFDRRLDNDRREGYSLDFHVTVAERRSGRERRGETEKRLEWTRITEWVSVPFKLPESRREGEMQAPDGFAVDGISLPPDAEYQPAVNLRSLNIILTCLVAYFENYMQPGQTAWLNSVNRETFERAKHVMRNLMEISTTGWKADAAEEPLPGINSADLRKKKPRRGKNGW